MWKEIEKEDIVNVEEGTKMRIGGCECVFERMFGAFYVEQGTLPDESSWMGSQDWCRWTVEVWEESETVTTTPPPFKDMKFRVRDEEHSKQIQETLFGLGYRWYNSGKVITNTDAEIIVTDLDGDIVCGDGQQYFENHSNPEHTIKPVGGFEIVPVEPDVPAKKMTKEEIEEILGYKVDIVSGK